MRIMSRPANMLRTYSRIFCAVRLGEVTFGGIEEHGPWAPSQGICRTPDTQRAAIQDVRIDHRRAHVRVAEQFLDGADVGA